MNSTKESTPTAAELLTDLDEYFDALIGDARELKVIDLEAAKGARLMLQALRAALRSLSIIEERYALLCRAVNECDCMDGCDSYGHEDNCPAVYSSVRMVEMQQEIERLRSLSSTAGGPTSAWVSANEKLPRMFADHILIAASDGWICTGDLSDDGFRDDDCVLVAGVTHWMPLPSHPTAGVPASDLVATPPSMSEGVKRSMERATNVLAMSRALESVSASLLPVSNESEREEWLLERAFNNLPNHWYPLAILPSEAEAVEYGTPWVKVNNDHIRVTRITRTLALSPATLNADAPAVATKGTTTAPSTEQAGT